MEIHFQRFIENSLQAECIECLFGDYRTLLEHYGFDRVGFAIVSNHPELSEGNALGLVESKNISDWATHYSEQNYSCLDPMQNLVKSNPGCFEWRKVRKALPQINKIQTRVFDEAAEAGLHGGAALAAHGVGQTKSSTLAASSNPNQSLAPDDHLGLSFAAVQMHTQFLRLKKYSGSTKWVSLSPKEKDVLTYLALGRSHGEISELLKISVHTVDYHLRNIYRKLDVKNAAAACAYAVQHGLISL